MIKVDFKTDLKEVLRKSYQEIKDKNSIYQFGVKTDGDISTLLVGYNTMEHYEKVSKSTLEEYGILYSECRWNMDEWLTDELGSLDKQLLDGINNYINSEPFESMDKDQKLDLIVESLIEIRKEGLFNQSNKKPILFIDRTDSIIDKRMVERIKLLIDDEEIFNKFYEEGVD
ncbi:DUF4303 domain-containing protein [Seonamhaeicola marinus]|uniref:DUF4303 domain-containing protein n=1 Tax=Seonamhaeicola marinus TaxID=1912246 RepID=A0A5D0IZZ3_9FLAO|nr:DUF4303 domain-containing protein [Seonamhaeicola marinus]TYA89254.1 DUF4303 domain-containing protein [Seonamhaeicola marinus]